MKGGATTMATRIEDMTPQQLLEYAQQQFASTPELEDRTAADPKLPPLLHSAQTVIDRVEEWMAVNDVSQADLARRAGFTGGSVWTWWSTLRGKVLVEGQAAIHRRTIDKLVAATGLTPEELTEPFK